MNYGTSNFANLLTNGGKQSQQRRIQGRTESNRHDNRIKDLACDTINCALAHWYFLPGLELQRYRLRLAFSLIRMPEEARRGFSIIPATIYLDSGFALTNLRAQSQLGSYLDVSSPWIFPFYVLGAFHPDRAVLLNVNATSRNLFRHLVTGTKRCETEVPTKELGHLSGLTGSFDTITCLARLSPAEKDRELLNKMWNALNPGGTLIVSLACAGSENSADTEVPAKKQVLCPAVPKYNSDLLKSNVLDVLGEPRGYAIYGEDTIAARIRPSAVSVFPKSSSWRESLDVGKHWRRCSSMSQVCGQGILAMKFIKPANLAAAREVS